MDPDMVNCIKLRLKSKTLHLSKCEHSVRVRKVKTIILWTLNYNFGPFQLERPTTTVSIET